MPVKTDKFVIILFLLSLPVILAKEKLCSEVCDSCPVISCSRTTADPCNCCNYCLRTLNETCGGYRNEIGVCEPGTVCAFDGNVTTQNETGLCVQNGMSSTDCFHSNCPSVVFQPKCPDDSILDLNQSKLGCCQQPGKCRCDLTKCPVPKCMPGSRLVRVEKGKKIPGACCSQYKCKEIVPNCIHVHCAPELPIEDCPSDSFRPPRAIPDGDCCPLDEECECRAGICQPAICPLGSVANITERGSGSAGSCCDQFTCTERNMNKINDQMLPTPASLMTKPCSHDGSLYHAGDYWHTDPCTEFVCADGVAFRNTMECNSPPDTCGWIEVPKGECCPMCFGCKDESGHKILSNGTWKKDDCTDCNCNQFGELSCDTQMCKVNCEQPTKIEGQCCPLCKDPTIMTVPAVCPSIEHCALRCEFGLRKDNQGCFMCQCSDISDDYRPPTLLGQKCHPLNSDTCPKKCAHGYIHDNGGCAMCRCAKCPPLHQCYKRCLYGFQSNMYGCPVCKCKARSTKDNDSISEVEQTGHKIDSKLKQNLACFEHFEGIVRDGGEWWFDGCRHCFCEGGKEYCSLITCPQLSCPHNERVLRPGDCCPGCRNKDGNQGPVWRPIEQQHLHLTCQSPGNGRVYVDGETWKLNGCVTCTCRVGHVLCHAKQCPPMVCTIAENDINDEKQCCPSCAHTDHITGDVSPSSNLTICTDDSNMAHREGSVWRLNECSSCVCMKSGIQCYDEQCQTHNTKSCKSGRFLKIKGKCCPICADSLPTSDVCSYESELFSFGESWSDGPCRNCTCENGGTTKCKELQCPPCNDPVYVKDRCCAICNDDRWSDDKYGHTDGSTSGSSALLLVSCVGVVLLIIVVLVLICWIQKRRNTHHTNHTKHTQNNGSIIHEQPALLPNVTKPSKKSSPTSDLAESLLSSASESSNNSTSGQSNSSSDEATNHRSSMYIDLKRFRPFRKRHKLAKPLSCHI